MQQTLKIFIWFQSMASTLTKNDISGKVIFYILFKIRRQIIFFLNLRFIINAKNFVCMYLVRWI